MAIELNGEFNVPGDRETVFDYLTDLDRVARCLPDIQGIDVKDDRNATLKIRVGVSFIRGTATVRLRLAEANRPESAKFVGQGSLMGSSIDIDVVFDLQAADAETHVNWRGVARVGGSLASVAGGVLEPLAEKKVVEFVEGVKAGVVEAGT